MYFLAGGGERSDWVGNLIVDERVRVRLGPDSFSARARVVEDPDEQGRARRLLTAKYQGWRDGREMTEWGLTTLPVAVDASR